MTPIHFAAAQNDIHLIDFICEQLGDDAKSATNVRNNEGWTPTHLAAFLGNFDSMNLLLENGADLTKPNDSGMSPYEEIIRSDHADLLECVYPLMKHVKRDMKKVSSLFYKT